MFSGSFSDAVWADVPPCPELAAVMDAAVFDELADDDLVELAAGRHRQIAAAQWAQVRAVAELARRRLDAEPGSETARSLQYLDSELACRLHITERAAGQLLFLALTLTGERAAAGELLATGLIDLAKACVFAHELDGIDEQLATQIENKLLPQAPGLTSGQLRTRIRRMIEKADPEAAARRRREAIASRDVTHWQNRDRTHTVAVKNLNGSTAGRILARIAARARALKSDGDPRPLHQIRADLASAILLGEYPNGYQPGHPDQPDGAGKPGSANGPDDPGDPGGSGDPDEPKAPQGPAGQHHPGEPSHPGTPGGAVEPNGQKGPHHGDGPEPAGDDPANRSLPHPDTAQDKPASRADPPEPGDPPQPQRQPGDPSPRSPQSERPWPPTAAPPAAEEDRPTGEPALDLPLDDHQRSPRSPFPQPRLGHWEPWHTPPGEDDDTDDDPETRKAREAAAVIARSMAALFDPFGPRPRAPAAVLARHAAKITRELTAAKSSSCVRTGRPGGTVIHGTGSYRPSPAIQKHVERRDQTCQFPACNRRAGACDTDHTIPYHQSGVTCFCNLVSLCRHHHIVKQEKNWHVYHPWPGILLWITPSGHWHIRHIGSC